MQRVLIAENIFVCILSRTDRKISVQFTRDRFGISLNLNDEVVVQWIWHCPPIFVVFFCSCNTAYHKQKLYVLLYFLGQIVT